MKDLYIYTLDEKGNLHTDLWKDVKVTRDTNKIVTKKDAKYYLAHGRYKEKEYLDKIQTLTTGFPNPILRNTEYISFDKMEVTEEIKKLLVEPFLERYNMEQEQLQQQINDLEELKSTFKNELIIATK